MVTLPGLDGDDDDDNEMQDIRIKAVYVTNYMCNITFTYADRSRGVGFTSVCVFFPHDI